MYILVWIIMGAVIGWIASVITNDNGQMGIIYNVIIGLVGSAIGGFVADLLDVAPLSIFSFWGFMFSILGAVALLTFVNMMRGGRR